MAETDVTTYDDAGKPDRRGFLRSMAAMPLLVAPALALRGGDDAELIGLRQEWEAAFAGLERTCNMLREAEERYQRESEHYPFPAMPADRQDNKWHGYVDGAGVRRMGLDEIRRHVACRPDQFIGLPELTEWAREALPAAEANQAALDGLRELCGVEAADEAQTEAYHRLREIEDRIRDAPARTLAGLAVKARVIEHLDGCDVDEEAHALARNILALVGETKALA